MVDLPEIMEPRTAYVGNIRALWEMRPYLAQQIDMVDEAEMIACQETRSGQLTCQMAGSAGEKIYLHSRYDPEREAARWADGVLESAEKQQEENSGRLPMCYLVDGFGLGYHVEALFERLLGDAFIVVSERNMALLRTALAHRDYAEMLASGRLIFITKTDREEIFKKLQQHSTMMMLGVVFTRSLQKVDNEFRAEVHKLIGEFASFMRSHMISLLANSIVTCKNILHNLPTYAGAESINHLKGRFGGCPAVVVSAGPSLQKNIELLGQIRDKVVLIAVQTTLKPLLARGIVPDFVTSLDYHEVSQRFFEGLTEEELKDVHLVAEPKATWHVIDAVRRRRGPISLLGNEFARLVLDGEDFGHDNLPGGATVAHLAFYLAEYMGAGPIMFVGQDLAFTDNVYYSPGTVLHKVWQGELNRFCTLEMKEWERIVRHRGILRSVEDIHGQTIYTDEQMFTYLQQFEKDFAKCSVKVIDATEGGARLQFCETMTLAEAAEQYCTKQVDRKRFDYRQEMAQFQSNKVARAKKLVKIRIKEVEELQEICNETMELVGKMIDLVDNQAALNRKMIRLDELRAMVRQREKTFRLVTFVSQAGEMFRFRQDRAIGIDNVQGKERQQRQLQRDVGYVTEIKKGCERLGEMLEECLTRFDEELEGQE